MIRECLAPWDSKEFAHILHGAGGTPVGGVSSFLQSQLPSNHPHPKSEKRVVPDKPFYYLLQGNFILLIFFFFFFPFPF